MAKKEDSVVPSSCDIPVTLTVVDEDGTTKIVELDDVKMALFMAMLTYFSNRFVDSRKSIELKTKKSMERVLNSDELISELIKPHSCRQKQPTEDEKNKKKQKSKHENKDSGKKKHRKHHKKKDLATQDKSEGSSVRDDDRKLEDTEEKKLGESAVDKKEEKTEKSKSKTSPEGVKRRDDAVADDGLNSLDIDEEFLKSSSVHHSVQPSFESEAADRLSQKQITEDDRTLFEDFSDLADFESYYDVVIEDVVPPVSESTFKPKTVDGLGPCELVWGPACYEAPLSRIADNTLIMTRYRNDPYRFIIAVAGTHPFSLTNWIVYDMNVKVLEWPYTHSRIQKSKSLNDLHKVSDPLTDPSLPGITAGTLDGLRVLLAMRDPGTGQSLMAKLASEVALYHKQNPKPSVPFEVTLTGHSLGGALCTALALYLECTRNTWDPHGHCVVKCVSFASPTIGNGSFVQLYESFLGSRTKRFHNELDMVSLAWSLSGLERIYTLYEPLIHTPAVMTVPLQMVCRMAARNGYKHVCSDQEGFVFDKPCVARGTDFMMEVIWQHNVVYYTYFGFYDILKCFESNIPLLGFLVSIKSKRKH